MDGPADSWSSDPGDVFARAGVDAQPVADVDVQRDLHDLAGLECGRLLCTADPVALQARIGLGDQQLDRGRDLDGDDLVVVERDECNGLLDV